MAKRACPLLFLCALSILTPNAWSQSDAFDRVISENCSTCHTTTAPDFPEFLWDLDDFQTKLESKNQNALTWLRLLNSKVVHGEMIRYSKLSKQQGLGKQFRDQIAQLYARHFKPFVDVPLEKFQRVTMVDEKLYPEYLSAMKNANIADPQIRASLLYADVIWDHFGAPTWSFAPHGGDSGKKGPRPVGKEPNEVPRASLFKKIGDIWHWKEPFDEGFAVDQNTRGLKPFFAVRFPRDAVGNIIKGIRGTEFLEYIVNPTQPDGYTKAQKLASDDLPSLWASFPAGTQLFEVFYTTQLDGNPLIVDILHKEKRISSNGSVATWVYDAVRADSSRQKIREWVQSKNDRSRDFVLIQNAVENPVIDQISSELGADGSGGTPFVIDGGKRQRILGTKSVLSGVSRNTLASLYKDLPLESSAGSNGWQLEPTELFSGSHRGIPIDSKTCNNCHSMAGLTFWSTFQNAGLTPTQVISYGQAPGYDGVLSAPWPSKQVLEDYVRSDKTSPSLAMRPEWGQFFENYQAAYHLAQNYRRVNTFKESDNSLLGERISTRNDPTPIRLASTTSRRNARVKIPSNSDYPVALTRISLDKTPRVNDVVTARFTIKNLSDTTSTPSKMSFHTKPNFVEVIGGDNLSIPALEPGAETVVTANVRPGPWVGDNMYANFIATLDMDGRRTEQEFSYYVKIKRSASILVFDEKGQDIASGQIKARAGKTLIINAQMKYHEAEIRPGPFLLQSSTTTPEFQIKPKAFSYGAGNPNGELGTVKFSYNIPESMSGKRGFIMLQLYDGDISVHTPVIYVDVE